MKSYRVFASQAQRLVMAVALLAATVMPAFMPAVVAAAQVDERSIALSSSSKGASNVTYQVKFTAVSVEDAGAFVVDFCSNSPIIGQTCTAPTGFDVGTPTSATAGFTDVAEVADDANNNTVRVTGTIQQNDEVVVDIAGITNPSTTDPLYARIITFDTETNADAYVSAPVDPDTNEGVIDTGGVALAITDTVGVSGAVLESMTFCAADAAISESCGDAASNLPVLTLGETVGTTVALVPGTTSTGEIFTQISTNAVGGATIWLKSSAACGGLKRLEAASNVCDISPSADGIDSDDAEFGLKAETVADNVAGASGTFQATNGYNNTTYLLNWVSGNATGVSSTYGDQVLNTNNAPANNKNMKLTFGAQANNNTPAGIYSADLSLIATGKF